jgi:hypothetical protein
MNIQVLWDDEAKQIVRQTFPQRWTWDDFFAARERSFQLIDAVSHKVAVIIDLPPDMALPPNVLTHIRSALRTKHANTQVIVFIMATPVLRTMMTAIKSVAYLAPVHLEHAPTLDEARAIAYQRLRQQDSTQSNP